MAETSFFTDLARGEHDQQLDALAEAIRARRKYLSQQKGLENKAQFTPGTKVKIAGSIRPQYLVGVTGTVSEHPARRKGDIQVNIDKQWQPVAARFGSSVGVPASCLEQAA